MYEGIKLFVLGMLTRDAAEPEAPELVVGIMMVIRLVYDEEW